MVRHRREGVSHEHVAVAGQALPFTSLDTLHEACAAIPQSRDMTVKVEQSFLAIKDSLKVAIDPLTQPLSW